MNITEEEISGMDRFGGLSHYWSVPSTYHNPEDNMMRDLGTPIETQYATISRPIYFKTPYTPVEDLIIPTERPEPINESYTRSDMLMFFLFFLMLVVLVIDVRCLFYCEPYKRSPAPQSSY